MMASPPASLCTALALAPAFVMFLCMACQGKGLLDWLVMRVSIITGPTCASAPLALEDTGLLVLPPLPHLLLQYTRVGH